MRITSGFVFLCLSVSACSSSPAEITVMESPMPSTRSASQELKAGGSANASAYVHQASSSKFNLGDGLKQASEYGFRKIIGSQGTFATDEVNGSVAAIPNWDSPLNDQLSYGDSPEAHSAFVRAYFTAAGLPGDQILDVSPLSSGVKGAKVGAPPSEHVTLRSTTYTAVLNRAVSGVRVPDSFAWARATKGQVIASESVYWPEIPGDVIDAAVRLKTDLDDPAARAVFEQKLPAGGQRGEVVIHHSSATIRDGFQAFASYDLVYSAQGQAVVKHFDEGGFEVYTQQELKVPAQVGVK